jgi:hypothetical protein
MQEELKARLDRDREVLAKRLDGERASREELQGEFAKLQRQTQALENVEEMLFKERSQRQRAERSIVELARSLGTLKAALLHAGLPVPPEARPSSALQNTVQVLEFNEKLRNICVCEGASHFYSVSNFRKAPLRKRENVRQECCRREHQPPWRAARQRSPHSHRSTKILCLSRALSRMRLCTAVKGVTKFQFLEQMLANSKILTSCTTLMQMAVARRLRAAATQLMTWLTFWSLCPQS